MIVVQLEPLIISTVSEIFDGPSARPAYRANLVSVIAASLKIES
jgi:hypothetical protein